MQVSYDNLKETVSNFCFKSSKIFGCLMKKVDCCKYQILGLLITNNLTWSAHMNSICTHAKKILGLFYIL